MISKQSALIVVDMQYDFMEGGALPVTGGLGLVPVINELMKKDWGLIVASQDWHPENHISFAENHPDGKEFTTIELPNGTKQELWPPHCIQNSENAEMHKDLHQKRIQRTIQKGKDADADSYSAFADNNGHKKTELDSLLKQRGITDIYVVGLARDYCTKFTAFSGAEYGYKVYFVWDATRAVTDTDEANSITRHELEERDVAIIKLADI